MQNQGEHLSADQVSFGTGKKYIMIACHPARGRSAPESLHLFKTFAMESAGKVAGPAVKFQTTPLVKWCGYDKSYELTRSGSQSSNQS
jgi:hypothetical protein